MYTRILKKSLINSISKGKIIVLYGPRQAGKTTLVKEILNEYENDSLYIPADIPSRRALFSVPEPAILKQNIGNAKLVVIDEAQTIENIGLILKVFIDTFPDVQIIATGSSSFDLANKIREPLTGRAVEYMLYPLSFEEVIGRDTLAQKDQEEFRMRFGWYPGINMSVSDATDALELLQSNTLYKDIFTLDNIQKPRILHDLVLQLAYRIGSIISVDSIANEIGATAKTVERYIDILEKMFVIVRLYPYSRNIGNERKKGSKIYFVDVGMRNSIIKDHKPLAMRQDTGFLFENYWAMERIKYFTNHRIYANRYFWQNYRGKEMDIVEEKDGMLTGYECKLHDSSLAGTASFRKEYPAATAQVITLENYQDTLLLTY